MQVRTIDTTKQSGIYIVGYSKNSDLRMLFEESLKSELLDQGFPVYTSYQDILGVTNTSADLIRDKANARNALVVLMVTPENRLGELTLPLAQPKPHNDLPAFVDFQQNKTPAFDPNKQTVAEVYAFLLNNEATPYYWSGVTYPYNSHSQKQAIMEVSKTLADALVDARNKVRR
ncbi:hypothetical protein [Thalassotalea aquiviva]|uniref:hypothetical protein n=1 Tax=Thalassotalea aquiviva TaxID=3242415 RepID=UPI00352A61A8